MTRKASPTPAWERLFEIASPQEGHFTTRQAADAGYSTQLLLKHIHAGRVRRVRHGIYRLVHYPPGEHEELAVVWLWSGRAGVFSHETALLLYDLSDVLPAQIHLTLPAAWTKRRFRVPKGVVLHHSDVPETDRQWFGPVPVTSPRRTLKDCALAPISPDLLRQAARQAMRRGLVAKEDLAEVTKALKPYGGIAA